MLRPTLLVAAMTLATDLALAEPAIQVSYDFGVPRIAITGSYPGSRYTVWRSVAGATPVAITAQDVACMASCYAFDRDAQPGQTYAYRFDLSLADGSRASFGPYPVTIAASLARATVEPNPGSGACRVQLYLAGSGAPQLAEARLFDAQGRVVRTLHTGPLARGLTTLAWDGRGDDGRVLDSGFYFLRFTSPQGTSVTRVARLR